MACEKLNKISQLIKLQLYKRESKSVLSTRLVDIPMKWFAKERILQREKNITE